jgi:hypothetical protein
MKKLFRRRFGKFREINEKYAQPRVKMNKGVAFALLLLRVYLILLVGILVIKFITLIKK